jgi:transcriptional regulator with XRE-family HTH domain
MVQRSQRLDPRRMAQDLCGSVGREVLLARTNHGLSVRAAARLAGVAPRTQARVEAGDPAVGVEFVCRVASAMGLKVWGRTFPATAPSLRDTGQLRIAEWLRLHAHSSFSVAIEHPLGDLRSADVVFFGATEILHVEIERLVADYQAQYRVLAEKREMLGAAHQRPVRLVLAIEDTQRNRSAIRPHASVVAAAFPAGTRAALGAIRGGGPLGRDAIAWIRRRRDHP